MTTLRCPLCRSTSWLTQTGLVAHLVQDHNPATVATRLCDAVNIPRDRRCRLPLYANETAALIAIAATPPLPVPKLVPVFCAACQAWHLRPAIRKESTS